MNKNNILPKKLQQVLKDYDPLDRLLLTLFFEHYKKTAKGWGKIDSKEAL